jgi:hypothetical protein
MQLAPDSPDLWAPDSGRPNQWAPEVDRPPQATDSGRFPAHHSRPPEKPERDYRRQPRRAVPALPVCVLRLASLG